MKIAAAALACVTLTASVPAAELILNGSIEQYHGLGRPYAWTFRKNAASAVNTIASRARTGRGSLAFDLSLGDGPEWDSRRYRVRPGGKYQARFYYRTDETISTGELFAFVRWWGDDSWNDWKGQARLAAGIGERVTGDWVAVEAEVTAPADAQFAEFHIWGVDTARGPDGLVLMDDFSLRPLPLASTAMNPAPADGTDGASLYTILEWDGDPRAESYDVYLGSDHQEVLDADRGASELLLNVPAGETRVRYAVTLAPYTQYFWRVDPVRDGIVSHGPVWSLATHFDWLEDIEGATAVSYGTRDHQGRGLDTLHIIENPTGSGYIGVYHSLIDGEFQARLATSTDLLRWTYRTTLAANADMPAIAHHAASGGFLLAHEQWGNPGSRSPSNLRFRYYASLADLLAGNDTRDYTAPLTQSAANGSDLEGTPSFLDVNADGNRIEVGFHFFDADSGHVDRNATGVLRRFLTGAPSWSTSRWSDVNEALIANEASANIGDRDSGDLFAAPLMAIEGQYTVGDFGSWRGWLWDFDRDAVFPLFPRTRRRSTALGNMTWSLLTSPRGKPAVCGAYFLFSEGAGSGEAGEVIFYHELQAEARGPTPASGADGVSSRPVLYWLAGAGVFQHDVYLGKDRSAVAKAGPDSPEYLGRTRAPLFEPDQLEPDATYFWRVDEVHEDGIFEDGVFPGPVWSFQTGAPQTPGDCNRDGRVDISDPVCVFGMLFLGIGEGPCSDGNPAGPASTIVLDWNGDGGVDISDGVAALGFLFGGGPGAAHVLGAQCTSLPGCPGVCF